jgi:hypothetical protein
MKLGFVGLPNSGKTTIFNAVTGQEAQGYAEVNLAAVPVPDARLARLAEIYNPKKITPAAVNFTDIAGLVKGSALGNRFLTHIRESDAIVMVLGCFQPSCDPMGDRETVNIELCMADIEIVERRAAKAEKAAKGDRSLLREAQLFKALKAHLDEGRTARSFQCSEEDKQAISESPLLTNKPILYCLNLSEDAFRALDSFTPYHALTKAADEEGAAVFCVCAKLEEEISQMDASDRAAFLEDLGITLPGRDRLIQLSYDLMGLMSFLTGGAPEVRAWTVKKGTKAHDAAGKIHNDIKRGFIRAEVVPFDALSGCGSMAAAKEKGLVRLEGKEYIMRDGDVVLFRFNV